MELRCPTCNRLHAGYMMHGVISWKCRGCKQQVVVDRREIKVDTSARAPVG
jgi:phage FluMu protein Com